MDTVDKGLPCSKGKKQSLLRPLGDQQRGSQKTNEMKDKMNREIEGGYGKWKEGKVSDKMVYN
jgi:hypothetical protein